MRYEIHISDVRSFRQCRRRWYFSSGLQRNLEPAVPYMPFFTGRAVHWSLEQYYGHGTDPVQASLDFINKETATWGSLWPREMDKLNEQIALIAGMLGHYKLWVNKYEGRLADKNFEFIALETSFRVPLLTDTGRRSSKVFLAGRFDGLVVNKLDGSYWLWEIKTTRSIDELYKSLALDEQCGTYIYAAEQMFGVHISGVMYTIMRKKEPTIPRVLNNGTLSKAQNIDTTAEIYLEAVMQNHPEYREDPEQILNNYGDILGALLAKGNTFFARVPIYRTRKEIATLSNYLWLTALEMTRQSTPLYPSPGWSSCNFCPFRSPCVAMNSGADWEMILESEFKSRTVELFTEEEHEAN